MTAHLSWETLNDLLDGRLAADEDERVRAHLASCESCRTQMRGVRDLLHEAQGLASEVEAPPAAWANIRATVADRKVVPFPGPATADGRLRVSRRALAAAAVVLIAVTSATTAVLLRRPATGAADGVTAPTALVSEVAAVEGEFLTTARELRAALDAGRGQLAPETIRAVERNLQVIDDAIAEARAALLADPANAALRDVLRNHHQLKVDFLRRAAALVQKA